MDSEQSAFAAAQMRHHRYMYFGKKQRYIEVFQCSGEDMSLVLSGGIPVPTAPVSPVGKTLLSPGMLNTPTILPASANPAAITAASIPQSNAAAALVPPPTGIAWDPISAQVAALQMQQAAIAQAQATYRSQQENVWLMNHLVAQQQLQQQLQQQMQLAALANAQKTQWSEFNGANATFLPTLPPPPPMTPVNSVVTSQTSNSSSPINKQKPIIPSTVFPVSSALHIPQATVSTSNPSQPFVLINIPRFTSPIQSYPAKVTGVTSTSTVNQAAIPSATAAALTFRKAPLFLPLLTMRLHLY